MHWILGGYSVLLWQLKTLVQHISINYLLPVLSEVTLKIGTTNLGYRRYQGLGVALNQLIELYIIRWQLHFINLLNLIHCLRLNFSQLIWKFKAAIVKAVIYIFRIERWHPISDKQTLVQEIYFLVHPLVAGLLIVPFFDGDPQFLGHEQTQLLELFMEDNYEPLHHLHVDSTGSCFHSFNHIVAINFSVQNVLNTHIYWISTSLGSFFATCFSVIENNWVSEVRCPYFDFFRYLLEKSLLKEFYHLGLILESFLGLIKLFVNLFDKGCVVG